MVSQNDRISRDKPMGLPTSNRPCKFTNSRRHFGKTCTKQPLSDSYHPGSPIALARSIQSRFARRSLSIGMEPEPNAHRDTSENHHRTKTSRDHCSQTRRDSIDLVYCKSYLDAIRNESFSIPPCTLGLGTLRTCDQNGLPGTIGGEARALPCEKTNRVDGTGSTGLLPTACAERGRSGLDHRTRMATCQRP